MGYPSEIEVAAEQFADPIWRLHNLYQIIPETGGEAIWFKPNWVQTDFLENLWYLNVILKARQLGFCLDPATRVLTADLRWVPIGDLRAGQDVVAVDEHPLGGRGQARRMRTATVIAAVEVHRPAYRIAFDDGRSVVCTGQHPWLSRKVGSQAGWRKIEEASKKRLTVGTLVRWITRPWGAPNAEDGWFGGLLDGEGNLNGTSLSVSQRSGPVLDRAMAYCRQRGYHYRVENDAAERPSKFGRVPVPKIVLSRMDELFRVIGQCRPARFVNARWWDGRELPGKRNGDVGWSKIVAIEPLGERTMVDLQTSTGTYIAEGFVSHNTTLIDLLLLDAALFNQHTKCGIIADSEDKAKEIFRDKIRFAYERLPLGLPRARETVEATKQGLLFDNGSSVAVGVSMRGLTLQYLHVSELGRIARRYPDKAEEIRTGALNTVHAGQYIFIESTAEGQSGLFYELCMDALNAKREGRKLTPLDFKFHFYPWWMDERYQLAPELAELVPISQEEHAYFNRIEQAEGIELSPGQRAWYVTKARTQRDKMKREYPSTPEEAFEVPIEGCYYGKEMAQARAEGRIRKGIPILPNVPVNVYWDLGRGDYTSLWFHQYVAPENRFLRYYQASGEGLAHYVRVLREWQQEKGIMWGKFYLPHDAGHKRLQDNKSVEDWLRELMPGVAISVSERTENVHDDIEMVRAILPTCWFDADGCKDGIRALDEYQHAWDDRLGCWKDEPLHNWASHGADAFREFAVSFRPAASAGGYSRGKRGSFRLV